MNNAQLINQDSGNYEYYSPADIIEAGREVMGYISLDPASSRIANKRIKAHAFFDNVDEGDGLAQPWRGNIWLNHPFSRVNNPLWINKLVNEYENGAVEQACCITYASTSEGWFLPLHEFYQCFPFKRVNYYLPDGTKKQGVTKGSVITYLGDNTDRFIEVFSNIGRVRPGAVKWIGN